MTPLSDVPTVLGLVQSLLEFSLSLLRSSNINITYVIAYVNAMGIYFFRFHMDIEHIMRLGGWSSLDMVLTYTRSVKFEDSLKLYKGFLK